MSSLQDRTLIVSQEPSGDLMFFSQRKATDEDPLGHCCRLAGVVLQAGALGIFKSFHLPISLSLLCILYFLDPSVPVHVVLFKQENILSHFLFGVEGIIWQE